MTTIILKLFIAILLLALLPIVAIARTDAPAKGYLIGDTGPAGGKVFYLTDATGLHGLEAAPVDQASAPWGCVGTSIAGTSAVLGTGKTNTALLVAGCAEANTAAKVVHAYRLNGYQDWYLPSKDELYFLVEQKAVVGGFASSVYWSSTEYNSNYAWYEAFNFGGQSNTNKDATLPVRAIRAFYPFETF